jgi:hypothetical protein
MLFLEACCRKNVTKAKIAALGLPDACHLPSVHSSLFSPPHQTVGVAMTI